jgi:hypothetical protein
MPDTPRTVASREMLDDPRFHGSMCDMAAYCSCGMTQNLANVEREAIGALTEPVRRALSYLPEGEVKNDLDAILGESRGA